MFRIDHCGNLIHFTKGISNTLDYEQAYLNLKNISSQCSIVGGTGMILGGHQCVCFTESPARCLTNKGELDSHYFSRYTPFGIQMTKKVVYNLGGRPVIYSNKTDYNSVKDIDGLKWRFVSYDPNLDGKLDFTWEREWRINTQKIQINPSEAKLVFPNLNWIERFIKEHEKEYHSLSTEVDCLECFCTRQATILNFTDFLKDEQCESLSGTCPDPTKFPWILINMNENIKQVI